MKKTKIVLSKMMKAVLRQQKRQQKVLDALKKIEFHENGKTKFRVRSEGYKIHQEYIDRILNSNY